MINKQNVSLQQDISNKLCVAYGADDNYAKYLGISMLSLFEANKDFDEIDVFVMDCEISKSNKKKLIKIADEFNRNIYFLNMKDFISGLKLNMGAKKISVASYCRLFLSSVIPDTYSKILYLDCDTIVTENLRRLWNVDVSGYMAAGVKDTVERYYLKKIVLTPSDLYVNAGVLLINLERWRNENVLSQFLNFIEKFEGNVPHHDQGTINAVCNKKIIALSPEYNVFSNMYTFSSEAIKRIYMMDSYYSQKDLDYAKNNPAIIHFTTGLVGRPWEKNCTHPMKDAFINVAKKSPWKNEPILPDSRGFALKAFTLIYRYTPHFLSENIYRAGNRIKELLQN